MADSSYRFTGRLVQVRQTGSQPLAQSVLMAGVAAVARSGQFGHRRTPGRLCKCSIPAKKTQIFSSWLVLAATDCSTSKNMQSFMESSPA